MKKGKHNSITDVKGIRVGHCTLESEHLHTGVTVVLPSHDNIFQNKLIAASHVINGFGKTTGLLQINELGTLESPIALTNTLSVGTVQQALVQYMLSIDKTIGKETGTVNVVVGECNDGYLNDIRACAITQQHVFEAIQNANIIFEQGSVGAGSGMSCFEMKGGIGSGSRIVTLNQKDYTIGILVLSNFGLMKDFIPFHQECSSDILEQGSIIMVIATDIPMSSRQLKRVCKRMSVPLSRLGSHLGNGSGDIAIAFSTAQVIPHQYHQDFLTIQEIHENCIDFVFRAAIDAGEEAIMYSLLYSKTCIGRDQHIRYSLKDMMKNKYNGGE